MHEPLMRGRSSLRGGADLNYIEKAGGGPVMPVALLPKSDKVGGHALPTHVPTQFFRACADGAALVLTVRFVISQHRSRWYRWTRDFRCKCMRCVAACERV